MTGATPASGPSEAPGIGLLSELADVRHLISSTVIDGVPVLFAHRDGPATAGLLFRVGWADEPLARNGITHLIEHLALHSQSLSDVHHNGTTSENWTHFHATGSAGDLVTYLNDVCAALRNLPIARMEVEKQILRTESAGRTFGAIDRQRLERYGASGPGLAAFEGFGLSAVTEADLQDWARERFTGDNAVVWITTATVPEGLDLRLPRGERQSVPNRTEATPFGRSSFIGAQGNVLIDAVVPRSTAATLFSRVASRALFRALRQEGGYSYSAQCEYEPIDAKSARITMFADALPDKQAAVMGTVVDVFAALRAGNIEPGDIESGKEASRQSLSVPSLGAALLPSTAMNLLLGAEIRDPVEMIEEAALLDASDVADVANVMWQGALAQIPEGALDWAGFPPAPVWSPTEMTGRIHPRFGDNNGALIIGPDGVSVRHPGGPLTVRFDQCEAVEVLASMARCRQIGRDGFSVLVEPTLHANMTPEVIRAHRRAVPHSL